MENEGSSNIRSAVSTAGCRGSLVLEHRVGDFGREEGSERENWRPGEEQGECTSVWKKGPNMVMMREPNGCKSNTTDSFPSLQDYTTSTCTLLPDGLVRRYPRDTMRSYVGTNRLRSLMTA